MTLGSSWEGPLQKEKLKDWKNRHYDDRQQPVLSGEKATDKLNDRWCLLGGWGTCVWCGGETCLQTTDRHALLCFILIVPSGGTGKEGKEEASW